MSRIAVLTSISRSFSASLALLFTAVSAFAQVTIRERVEIHPRKDSAIASPQQASSSAISPGTIRFDFSFGGSLQPGWPHNFFVARNACVSGGLILLSGGSPSLSFPALAVEYGYGATIWTLPGGSATFSVYLDGELIQQYSHPISCKCRLYLPHWVTLFDNFDLTAGNNSIPHGESNSFQLLGSITNLCSPTVWHPELQTTFTMTSGSELGEFVDQNGQSLGTSVTRKGSELDLIRFAANGEQPRGPEGTVVVEASTRGITKTVSFTVLRTAALVDHFEIRLEPEEIAFTEASRIFVQAKDANNQDIEFDENEKLLFYLKTNPEYGTFIDAKGDTIKTSPPSLADVSYRDAHDGKVRFSAVRTNPKIQATSVIRVEWQQDPTKAGEKEITVLEKTLKIVMDGERTVQLVIPPATNARPRVENRKPFAVRWTRGGILQGDQPFRLTTDYVDGSGGHDHITPRRPNADENYGRFISTMDGATGRPFQGRTRSDQMVPFDYVASQFGGQMVLRVQATENALLWDTLSVVERVPGLEPLPGPTDYYEKVGGTNEHHGPPDSEPDNNHWGHRDVLSSLVQIATTWRILYPNEAILMINDLSLPNGGLFDKDGNWSPPHSTHRNGRDIDVRTEFPGRREGIPIRAPRTSTRLEDVRGHPDFEELCRTLGARRTGIHGTRGTTEEHYHIYY